ncbi:Uncharacterised protein [Salmonella enterica subsp. arizonae]|uniref:Uncharacterized protein n=1 Tax=Salmonella enterica subsp. arizonae TaxID=59203 RepID=A0A379T4B5_SALER|nr:Uncharacterised protein [Salmonella enterica subsp. arizonae]
MYALTQFFRTGQVETAPGGGFGLITQLFEGVSLQVFRCLIARIRGNYLFEKFRRPAIVPLAVGVTGEVMACAEPPNAFT